MSGKDNGGTAFPESYVGADSPHEGIGNGMTLRQWYAGQIAGVCLIDSESYTQAAARAFEFADAMIAEGKKP